MQKACRASFQASGFFGPAIFGLIFGLSGSGLGPNPPLILARGRGTRGTREQLGGTHTWAWTDPSNFEG